MSHRSGDETQALASAPYYQPLHNPDYHDHPPQPLHPVLHPAADRGEQQEQVDGNIENSAVIGTDAGREENQVDDLTQVEKEAQFAQLLETIRTSTAPREPQSGDLYHTAIHNGSLSEAPYHHSMALGKRKRSGRTPSNDAHVSLKRPRSNGDGLGEAGQSAIPQHSSQPSVATARAAGVHSAVALFRSPSASAAKKYTRPPMAKLYSSLHLTPADFLHLQAAAKTYMLDTDHPDRQECVGVRGQTSVDMAKLRLFNCVKEFLEQGAGERFFPNPQRSQNEASEAMDTSGAGFDVTDSERWIWPKDAESIISLVTPLMRRMVTNERQRMYAAETRKGGSAKKTRSEHSPTDDLGRGSQEANGIFGVDSNVVDPSLRGVPPEQPSPTPARRSLNLIMPAPDPRLQTPSADQIGSCASVGPLPPPALKCSTDVIQFIFMRGKTKLLRFDWPNDPEYGALHAHMSFKRLVDVIAEHVNSIRASSQNGVNAAAVSTAADIAKQSARATLMDTEKPQCEEAAPSKPDETPGELIRRELQQQIEQTENADGSGPSYERPFEEMRIYTQALTANGLFNIDTEEHWEEIKRQIAETAWLEGCLRVVVDVL